MFKIEENLTFGELLENLKVCNKFEQAYIMLRPYMIDIITDKLFIDSVRIHYVLVEDGVYALYEYPRELKVESLMFEKEMRCEERQDFYRSFADTNYEVRIEKWNSYMSKLKTVLYKGE